MARKGIADIAQHDPEKFMKFLQDRRDIRASEAARAMLELTGVGPQSDCTKTQGDMHKKDDTKGVGKTVRFTTHDWWYHYDDDNNQVTPDHHERLEHFVCGSRWRKNQTKVQEQRRHRQKRMQRRKAKRQLKAAKTKTKQKGAATHLRQDPILTGTCAATQGGHCSSGPSTAAQKGEGDTQKGDASPGGSAFQTAPPRRPPTSRDTTDFTQVGPPITGK